MKRAAGFKVLGMMGAGLALAGTGVAAPLAALADVDATSVQVIEREAIEYDKIPNVAGEFSFCQDALTPGDDVFNLFGTATTTVCAKPGFAFDQVSRESYYLNIGGEVQKVYTIGLDQIEQMESEMQDMRCTCGMSPALAMVQVEGVKVADILSMADIDPDVNGLDNVYLYDIDDLKEVVEENLATRRDEAQKAAEIVDEEVDIFRQWLCSLDVQPTIVDLIQHGENAAHEEVARTLKRLGHVDDATREAIEVMALALVRKLNHDPIMFLKRGTMSQEGSAPRISLMRRIFNLDQGCTCSARNNGEHE